MNEHTVVWPSFETLCPKAFTRLPDVIVDIGRRIAVRASPAEADEFVRLAAIGDMAAESFVPTPVGTIRVQIDVGTSDLFHLRREMDARDDRLRAETEARWREAG